MGTDPFVKTWWFLEARDGSWLADDKHELFTRDPNEAMKWPNKTYAGWAMARMRNALWLKLEGPTEHTWVDPAAQEPDHGHLPPINREFAHELERALRQISASDALRGRHTNFNGEIRSMAKVVEVAANMIGRPLAEEEKA